MALRRPALVVLAAMLLAVAPGTAAAAPLQARSARVSSDHARAHAVPGDRAPQRRLSAAVQLDPRRAGSLPPAIAALTVVAVLVMGGGLLGRVVRRRLARDAASG